MHNPKGTVFFSANVYHIWVLSISITIHLSLDTLQGMVGDIIY